MALQYQGIFDVLALTAKLGFRDLSHDRHGTWWSKCVADSRRAAVKRKSARPTHKTLHFLVGKRETYAGMLGFHYRFDAIGALEMAQSSKRCVSWANF